MAFIAQENIRKVAANFFAHPLGALAGALADVGRHAPVPGRAVEPSGLPAAVVIVLATKFTKGAWIVVIAMPIIFFIMKAIHRTCLETAEEYGTPGNYLNGANIGLYFDGRLSNPLCFWVVRLQHKTMVTVLYPGYIASEMNERGQQQVGVRRTGADREDRLRRLQPRRLGTQWHERATGQDGGDAW